MFTYLIKKKLISAMLLRWRDQSKEKRTNKWESEMEHSYCCNKRVEQEKSPIVSTASVSMRRKKKQAMDIKRWKNWRGATTVNGKVIN